MSRLHILTGNPVNCLYFPPNFSAVFPTSGYQIGENSLVSIRKSIRLKSEIVLNLSLNVLAGRRFGAVVVGVYSKACSVHQIDRRANRHLPLPDVFP